VPGQHHTVRADAPDPTLRTGGPSSAEVLHDLVRRRRDVRGEFTGEPVAVDVLGRVLAAAHAAPSVGLSQPWDFIRVTDERTRRAFHAHVRHERAVFAATLTGQRAERFARIRIDGVLTSSISLVVTYDAARGGPAVLGRHAIADAGLYSVCLAVENLWLAATAEGLGVGWVSFYREPFVRELLGIPAEIRPVAWLCLGPVTHLEASPDLERDGWASRRPLAEVVHAERWGGHDETTTALTLSRHAATVGHAGHRPAPEAPAGGRDDLE
jgi:5,6-dimethylbenzimidazole synthase